MSQRIIGLGGFVRVYDFETDALIGVQHNTDYEIDVSERIDEATDSESTGFEDGEPILGKVESVVINCIEKDDQFPELVGLEIGQRVSLSCKQGSDPFFDNVVGTIVKSIRKSNPQTGLRRITVTCEYGEYAGNTDSL